ncbi:NAD(P)-dependent oxidoreductase [bacterium]|nr:NAD(P)-dependent oxidoreductase [bacterium]
MNILITGATGFIGKSFLKYIKEQKLFEQDNIILLSSKKIDDYQCILHNNYTFTKEDFIKSGINAIDIVFHLGAAAPKTKNEFGVEFGYKFSTNVINTAYLLNNLPSVPSKFIFISSTSVYKQEAKIDENTLIQTEDLYGASKILCEKYLEEKSRELGFTLQILRLGQIYGEGEESYSKIVSFFVKQILNDKPITVFGTGNETRSMLYVKDCVKCIAKAVDFDEYIGPCNIASSQSIAVNELVSLIYKILKKPENVTINSEYNSTSVLYNNSKMKKYYKIDETPIELGIENYVKYYEELLCKL